MNRSPDRLNLDHLKKQAKDLIRSYRSRDTDASARVRHALTLAAGRSDAEIASLELCLHDAQSMVARHYGIEPWTDLKRYVEVQSASRKAGAARVLHWLGLVYVFVVDGSSVRVNLLVAGLLLA